MQYVRAIHALGPPSAPQPKTVLLGPTYPPNWVEAYSNRSRAGSVMARIFASVNRAAGIACTLGGKAQPLAERACYSATLLVSQRPALTTLASWG